eukprot:TRINITY_DN3742_c0_g3_i1.p1 TRINITY_DN3742_c0_g3~~TRINITY_DN3742_c0_g3_i1.p1  ORF type:complete len:164 (+),score=10.86 TRINITY_DN3742_c0_g3_i1:54-494(+)
MSAPASPHHVVCNGCTTTLAYPLGAPSVRCPICEVVTVIRQVRVQCSNCHTPLLLPMNTALALCPCCGLVMRVPRTNQRPQPAQQPQQQPPEPRRPVEQKCMVYVHNPPTLVNGKLVASVSVGTKVSDTPAPKENAQQASPSQGNS